MNTGLYVDKHYTMNPEFDDLLSKGTKLKDGMIVLIEDSMVRGDVDRIEDNKYELERVQETNQWCTVTEIEIMPRFDYDQYGVVVGQGHPLISFIAVYPDGVKRKRRYDASYAWIVKKDSIPTEEEV